MKLLFRTLLNATLLITATAFLACSSDSSGDDDVPSVSVSPNEGIVQLSGGTASTIIETSNAWTLTIPAEYPDVVPSKTSGKGKYTLNIQVGASTVKRTIPVTVTVNGKISGFPVTKTATFTINQNDGGVSIYYEDCGDKVSKDESGYWPYVDKFEGWTRKGGDGVTQTEVTYTGKDASVRNSGTEWDPGEYADCSGAPYAYIAKSASNFLINKIKLKKDEKSYTFTFTAIDTYASLNVSPFTPATVEVTPEVVTLSVSVDGVKWANLSFDYEPTGEKGWYWLSAPFKLPEAADYLYVQFSNFKPNTTKELPSSSYDYQASLRLDDFDLCTGGNGPVIDFNDEPGPKPTELSIADMKKAGPGTYTVTGTVAAEGTTGFVLGDKTGAVYVFKKGNGVKKGDKLTVSGSYEAYSNGFEFNDPTITTASTAEAYSYNPTSITGSDLDTMLNNNASCNEFVFTGTAVVGSYVNITVDGATTAMAGLTAVNADDYKQYDGQTITVKGFHIANAQNKYCNFVPYEVVSDPSAPTLSLSASSLQFQAEGGTQTLTATTNNLSGFTLSATSSDSAFTASLNGNTISVSAGSTSVARNATLTVKYSNGAKSVEKTVTLKQSAPSTGGEKTLTLTLSDIVNGKSGSVELGKSAYGSQAETDESTWYTWTSTYNFAGCRICQGKGDQPYNTDVLQMQGNSDHHGFILNTVSLGKIKSIEVLCLNSKSTNKPAYTMYFGTTKNPSENGEVATGAKAEGSESPFSFTDKFEPTGDFSYFKLCNTSTYAVYIKSITIVYED